MNKRKELVDEVYNLAFKYEAELGSCPQCVLAALYETLGIGDPDIIKAVDALAGGTSLSTEGTCGALIGGLVAISSIVEENIMILKKEKEKDLFLNIQKNYMINSLTNINLLFVKGFIKKFLEERLIY